MIDRYKSGLQSPGDIPFEDLSSGHPPENHNPSRQTPKSNTLRGDTKGTISGGRVKTRKGFMGIFSSSKVCI